MSDFILKFWPKETHTNDQTELLKSQLKIDDVISEETTHWGKPAFKAGGKLGELIGIDNQMYLSQLKVQVEKEGYGVERGEEDFEYINRPNVVAIQNGDGEIENWAKFEEYLSKLTGKRYKGGWELL
ncbi:MAG: hypothetical protein R2824_05470 [Saprospiraceae bacterium]